MGNSIHRARRRPRVHSMSFRSFFWLVPRVALLYILHDGELTGQQSPLGIWILRAPLSELRRMAYTYLHRNQRRPHA